MEKKKTIVILFGGVSGEHNVSLISAGSVLSNIDRERFNVIPVLIDRNGTWFTNKEEEMLLRNETKEAIEVFLPPQPKVKRLIPLGSKKLPPSMSASIDCVFPVLHGPNGEDGTIQGLLTLTDIPFVGAGVVGSAIGMDKEYMKIIFREAGLPVVDFEIIRYEEYCEERESILNEIIKQFELPVFVKPANLGSSVGITKVKLWEDLPEAVKKALKYDNKIIIEQGIEPARELECSVLGNCNPRASEVGEIIPSGEFYDYEAKYIDNRSELIVPARIPKRLRETIQEYSITAFKAIDCRGMARVDFLYNLHNELLFINELNTIPGFTPISMYPRLWQESGIEYSDLITELIELALEEHKSRKRISHMIE